MNSRKVVFLFWSTLLVGSITGGIVGSILNSDRLLGGGFANFFWGAVWAIGISAAFSLISQMGFFAYLTLHRFGLGIFKSVRLWNRIQMVVIAFVVFDLFYLRYAAFAEAGESIWSYMVTPVLLLIYGLVIAAIKAKDTNRQAFIQALFFIVVVTTIEWVPALTANDPKWLWIYFTPLLAANTWQLLILHRLTGSGKQEAKK
ncbi:KinB-signaling pathway activation protein [Alkalicoccobacillus plakortidis]|uniref:KinB-signaling pathway activation protein n=1 Tax=Alkalicoccobacillus plakortidis TaxID=444060 RepID=A0ABT0XP23_9BACI|nr:KinB-signaling pathway activation protein [Alkalicoccobacillus plakortidis]MCM2677644.1 KinB-signaling pathway activation protein [Alkalicoccobacillus plakortidis]